MPGRSRVPVSVVREGELIRRIMLRASESGDRLFRNNTGVGWVGTVLTKTPKLLVLKDYRIMHAGLVVGGSDLIGWSPREIHQGHVGSTLAIFTAIEAKTGRLKPTHEQETFLAAVERAGGIARVVREGEV